MKLTMYISEGRITLVSSQEIDIALRGRGDEIKPDHSRGRLEYVLYDSQRDRKYPEIPIDVEADIFKDSIIKTLVTHMQIHPEYTVEYVT